LKRFEIWDLRACDLNLRFGIALSRRKVTQFFNCVMNDHTRSLTVALLTATLRDLLGRAGRC
jgi:hypothetical protein